MGRRKKTGFRENGWVRYCFPQPIYLQIVFIKNILSSFVINWKVMTRISRGILFWRKAINSRWKRRAASKMVLFFVWTGLHFSTCRLCTSIVFSSVQFSQDCAIIQSWFSVRVFSDLPIFWQVKTLEYKDSTLAGRTIQQLVQALEEVEQFHQVSNI